MTGWITLHDEEIYSFPGLFEPDSSSDQWLLRARDNFRKNDEENRRKMPMTIRCELTAADIVDGNFNNPNADPLSEDCLENEQIGNHFDMRSLVTMDSRVRFCRCVLARVGLPYDYEKIRIHKDMTPTDGGVWAYESEIEKDDGEFLSPQNPLDWLFAVAVRFSPSWYAVKFLAHFRRLERLWDDPKVAEDEALRMGLVRESMLMGETWTEAKHVVNFGDATIRGEKVAGGRWNKAPQESDKLHAPSRDARMDHMRELTATMTTSEAARRCARQGLGTQSAILRQWYRQKKV